MLRCLSLQLDSATDDGAPIQEWLNSEIDALRVEVAGIQAVGYDLMSRLRFGVPFTEEQTGIASALVCDEAPRCWRRDDVTMSVSEWLAQVNQAWHRLRGVASGDYANWLTRPLSVWLHSCVRPIAFFEALRIMAASREIGCSLDGVKLVGEVGYRCALVKSALAVQLNGPVCFRHRAGAE